MNLSFDNRFWIFFPQTSVYNYPRQVYSAFHTPVAPEPVRDPKLVAHSREAAQMILIRHASAPRFLRSLLEIKF